jgi:hypothetical protein
MPKVEVFEMDEKRDFEKLLFKGEFAFLPRIGETISKDVGGYFSYYDVVAIWHVEEGETGIFQACVQVKLDD